MSSNSTISDDALDWNARQFASVVLVCSLFIVLSYYSVLKRLCCGASSSGNQAQRRLPGESNGDHRSQRFQSHGLELCVIRSLPVSMFKRSEGEEKMNNADCAICLGEFEEGEWLKHLPNCTHVFHVSCIDSWFLCHPNCPLCRSHVHDGECSVSSNALLESLRREEFFPQQRAALAHYHSIRSDNLQNHTLRYSTLIPS